MTKLVVDITTSLDGFIAGPDISNENPMGKEEKNYTIGSSAKKLTPMPKFFRNLLNRPAQ